VPKVNGFSSRKLVPRWTSQEWCDYWH